MTFRREPRTPLPTSGRDRKDPGEGKDSPEKTVRDDRGRAPHKGKVRPQYPPAA